MKKILFYLCFVMYLLCFLGIKYVYTDSDFAMSISFLLMCIGCVFAIPNLYTDFKEYKHYNYWIRCTATLVFSILGSIGFFILAIAFLPYFGL